MSVKGIIKNIRKYGIADTWKLFRQRDSERKHLVEVHTRLIEKESDLRETHKEEYDEYIRKLKDPKEFKQYLREMHDRVVKEELPAIYYEAAKAPVENKIVFMDKGHCPTPSGYHLGKVLEAQGKYEVKYIGLSIRRTTYIKYWESVREFIREAATAKAIFISTANDFFSFIDMRPETKLIQLWHGVGMFKKVGYSTIESKGFGPNAKYREEFDQYKNYSYVTIASESQAWQFEDAMHISRDSGILAPVGISRTDLFYDPDYKQESLDRLYEVCPKARGRKIIVYAPTFRGTVNNAKAPDVLDIRKMAEALSDEYVLLIKHHDVCKEDRKPLPEDLEDDFVYDMNAKKGVGIERLLAIADICMSDYSSVAFEYAIMEKPIIFFAYDLEDYIDERGMYFTYDEITPGPVCKTTDEVIDYIKALPGSFNKQEVIDFKNKYIDMCDGHATERTIALIEK